MITRFFTLRSLIYLVAVVVLALGFLVGSGHLAEAQSGTWASCQRFWFGMTIGPPECGSPPPGSECSASCSGNLPGFCPTDYCWSVFIPTPPPACPTQGQGCSSGQNSCGMTGSGTINSSCVCTASTPSDALCPPPSCSNGSSGPYPACPLPSCSDFGQLGTYPFCYNAPTCVANTGSTCYSNQNSCGMTGSGSVQCDGSCSANVPSDALCPSGPGPSAPNASLTANPTSITSGGSSTLTWSSTNASSCTGGGFSTGGATSGTRSVSPSSTATYTVTCTGAGGSDTDDATVTVTGGGSCSGAGPLDASGTPGRISDSATPVTITWSGSNINAASCTLTNLGTGSNVGNSAVSSCSTSGSATVSGITAQTTYRVTCGSLTRDVVVNVVPKYEEF